MKRWIAPAVLVGYLAVQLATLKGIGLTDDDDFYIPAGISYAEWLGRAVRFDGGAFTRAAIDQAFQINREHPPLAKYALGICHFAFRGMLGPTDSARVATVLFSTLAAGLLLSLAMSHLYGARGVRTGVFAVVALLTMPRFFFHSHAGTLDVPVAAMYLLAAWAALRAERSRWMALLAGPIFGLALLTKLNAPFLLVAYGVFVLITRFGRAPAVGGAAGVRLPSIPLAMISMVVLGVAVFFALWPWLWFEPSKRVAEYVGFHLNHYGIYFLYFGRVFSKNPFAPWHAPFVMAAGTIPLATSVLAFAGAFGALPAIAARVRFREGPDDDFRKEGDLLLFTILNAGLTISTVAFGGTPIYGGEKLFMPFFPFWCLLAGYGANLLYERLALELRQGALRRWVPGAAALAACASGVLLQLRFGGYALSEYNGLVGGLRGATAIGFERQYYDIAFRDLVAWLSKEAPPNLRVHFLPNNWEYVRTYRWYRNAGELRRDIEVVDAEAQADWIVITHERRFARYAEDLSRYRGRPVLLEKIVDGTPIWSVVKVR